MFIMNRLSTARRVQIVSGLVEGNSLRATSRMADVSINTVTKLLVDLGHAALKFQDETLRDLRCKRIEWDKIWAFVGGKDRNLPEEKRAQGLGSIWTWTALCADTKLIVTWLVGGRDAGAAYEFMQDLAARLRRRRRVLLTTDGHKVYLNAVEDAFGADVDYAMLTKVYGAARENETRYSPAEILSSTTEVIKGVPNPKLISTSYVERQNLTMRMSMRRFTRLTNGFSKKAENHAHAVALHFLHYNFVRIHKTLRVTPAMEAGVAKHPWTIEEIVGLLGN
jgi:IS1 family transposase